MLFCRDKCERSDREDRYDGPKCVQLALPRRQYATRANKRSIIQLPCGRSGAKRGETSAGQEICLQPLVFELLKQLFGCALQRGRRGWLEGEGAKWAQQSHFSVSHNICFATQGREQPGPASRSAGPTVKLHTASRWKYIWALKTNFHCREMKNAHTPRRQHRQTDATQSPHGDIDCRMCADDRFQWPTDSDHPFNLQFSSDYPSGRTSVGGKPRSMGSGLYPNRAWCSIISPRRISRRSDNVTFIV